MVVTRLRPSKKIPMTLRNELAIRAAEMAAYLVYSAKREYSVVKACSAIIRDCWAKNPSDALLYDLKKIRKILRGETDKGYYCSEFAILSWLMALSMWAVGDPSKQALAREILPINELSGCKPYNSLDLVNPDRSVSPHWELIGSLRGWKGPFRWECEKHT